MIHDGKTSAPLMLTTEGAAATRAVGGALAPLLEPGDVLLLSGDLGAGKTQLVKGIADGLGVEEPVTSPTFNILIVHSGRIPLYHIDLYRLERDEQLDDIDWWGVLEGDGVSAVEWGDRFPESLPASFISVRLHIDDDTRRTIEIAAHGERAEGLSRAWAKRASEIQGVSAGETP